MVIGVILIFNKMLSQSIRPVEDTLTLGLGLHKKCQLRSEYLCVICSCQHQSIHFFNETILQYVVILFSHQNDSWRLPFHTKLRESIDVNTRREVRNKVCIFHTNFERVTGCRSSGVPRLDNLMFPFSTCLLYRTDSDRYNEKKKSHIISDIVSLQPKNLVLGIYVVNDTPLMNGVLLHFVPTRRMNKKYIPSKTCFFFQRLPTHELSSEDDA